MSLAFCCLFFFFFNDTATTKIYTRPYTLSLHDALPISGSSPMIWHCEPYASVKSRRSEEHTSELQSHGLISYAVFCLKKKNTSEHPSHGPIPYPPFHSPHKPTPH